MSEKKRIFILAEAFIISFGLMLFSFFIQYKNPVRLISFVALSLSAVLISRNLVRFSEIKNFVGLRFEKKDAFAYILIGAAAGISLAVFYRWYYDLSLFTKSIYLFGLIAALIGSMEELVFRGFLQNMVKGINGLFSVLFSSISHTGYKCLLFMAPGAEGNVNMKLIFFWTLGLGLLFGTIRHCSKSIIVPLTAHAIFDIVVYAGYSNAPWWVW